MAVIGYHASHEQFPPSALLGLVARAEDAGFNAAMSSDHIAPWSSVQGQAGFAWSWLGAALQATERLSFGSIAVPVGYRYHPVIVAQAAATLAEMFPGRFRWIGAGSGQALNEHVVAEYWPGKAARNERLKAGVEIIRALWAGETVTRRDGPIHVSEAKLWTRPPTPPLIHGAALSPETARFVGGWADGLVTINQPLESLRKLVGAFREGGGEGKPMALQVHLSWAPDDREARDFAYEQWRSNAISAEIAENLTAPAAFEGATKTVRPEDMDEHVIISASPQLHVDRIGEYRDLGFKEIHLHNVGPNQEAFIEAFGRSVLPAFAR